MLDFSALFTKVISFFMPLRGMRLRPIGKALIFAIILACVFIWLPVFGKDLCFRAGSQTLSNGGTTLLGFILQILTPIVTVLLSWRLLGANMRALWDATKVGLMAIGIVWGFVFLYFLLWSVPNEIRNNTANTQWVLGLPHIQPPPLVNHKATTPRNPTTPHNALPPPVLRIDPYDYAHLDRRFVGAFTVTLTNYGPGIVEHAHAWQDYFKASRVAGNITFKLTGSLEAGDRPDKLLKPHDSMDILLQNPLLRNSGEPQLLPTNNIDGVKLTIVIRRASDGQQFYYVTAFGFLVTKTGPIVAYRQGSVFDNTWAGSLSLRDLKPYLDSPEHWTGFENRHEGAKLLSGNW